MTSRHRIVIVNEEKCKPSKCQQECKTSCPVVQMGSECITITKKSASVIESQCTGCRQCVKVCPFSAISVINLPTTLNEVPIHRYGQNTFVLYRLPIPRPGSILGIVGSNGLGKSTLLKILAAKTHPNLGQKNLPSWEQLVTHFRGSELQNYFTKILQDKITPIFKPQYVDTLPQNLSGSVEELLRNKITDQFDFLVDRLELRHLLNRSIKVLSGGELQRFAVAATLGQTSSSFTTYIFDEPSSYLDIRQRLGVSSLLRDSISDTRYILCVEHDLSLLDYISDYVCCVYGQSGAYGIVTAPFSCRDGINHFLNGYIPSENMRFREQKLDFTRNLILSNESSSSLTFSYPSMTYTVDTFTLNVVGGTINAGHTTVLLGENGLGKTTFIRLLAGKINPTQCEPLWGKNTSVSHKPQMISPKFPGTVRELFFSRIKDSFFDSLFEHEVLQPLSLPSLYDCLVTTLSGGELQRVAIALCLGTPAEVYLLDEPSTYLDSEQRLNVALVIKRFIANHNKYAFIVDHDFMMAIYLADSVISFSGSPGVLAQCPAPVPSQEGINTFLRTLDITFRRDPSTGRPRINKPGSNLDREQKSVGKYFFGES